MKKKVLSLGGETFSMGKTLNVTSVEDAVKKVTDIEIVGNGNLFQLISKASSMSEGWMKSTTALEVPGVGCVLQVTTQQKNYDGSYSIAEALTFVPGSTIVTDAVTGHKGISCHRK